MAMHIHRADGTDRLVGGLGALLAVPADDPFTPEVVIVAAKGVERWLAQQLSHVLGGEVGDGVCAGVRFPSPHSLVAELTGTAETGDPWSPEVMVWPLLAVVDAHLDAPWAATLAAHLGHLDSDPAEAALRRGRRYAVARRLAGLFSSYARQRPQILEEWAAGGDGGVAPDLAWQAPLWRALLAHTGAETPGQRHARTVAALRACPAPDLPSRLSLFGHTRLPGTEIALLEALSTHHELHLWLPHPSDALWRTLAGAHGAMPRGADTSHRAVAHPLLATLGRDVRELQRALPAAVATDEHLGDGARPETLLGWLQSDLAADAVRPAGRRIAADDRSVQVHSCHGRARQIDVLREVLLGLLEDDPTLEPRDILVMCPDIEHYAPLVGAGFGLGDLFRGAHPAHQLRVRLADRALTQTNPLLGVASRLLDLATGRATASELLDLAEAPPVRLRFGFTDDDLDVVRRWVRDANVRWGFDQAHRRPWGVDAVQNTWRFGLDRILAGVAVSEDAHAWIATTLPLDDVGSNRVDLAGRLAEYVERLRTVVASLTGAQPLTRWLAALTDGVALLTDVTADDAWQSTQLQRAFAAVAAEARTHGADHAETELLPPDVRALLTRRLAGRPTRANFRTGTLTVCTMVPMRSVPHRVVCLVGLDDGVFPRAGAADGDDVLARDPHTGERDVRSEDRQLLLDAVVAAGETLVVTYTGADEHSGLRRPPAVPVGELLDALDATTDDPVGTARDRVLVAHPLQPFDVRNVTPGALGTPGRPFTFDPTALSAACASVADRAGRPGLTARPLPVPPPDDVALDDLVRFLKDPVRGFFRALDVTLLREVDPVLDAMPIELDGLQQWQVADRMLDDVTRGMTKDSARHAEWRRGALPPGKLGWKKATTLVDTVHALAAAAAAHRSAAARAVDVDVDLGDGRRLSGTVAPVYGERLVSATYSRLDGRHLLPSWIHMLALTAHSPGTPWSAVGVGRAKYGERVRERIFDAPADAAAVLRDLVALYDAGRRAPLPLPPKTSFAWAEGRRGHTDHERVAGEKWVGSDRFPGENAEAAAERVWGARAPLTVLTEDVRDGEGVPGESTRLGAYAARLWAPMLDAERTAP